MGGKERGLSLRTLFEPIDPSSLAVFRIMWSLIMMFECWTFIGSGMSKTKMYYYSSSMHFKYYGFEWVGEIGEERMREVEVVMMMSVSAMAIGLLYRLSCLVFALCFSYLYLLEGSYYLNHLYLALLIQFILIFTPANASYSIDNILFPSSKREYICKWNIWIFRFILVIVYFYAGIAKLNYDWMRAQPLLQWLPKRSSIRVIGGLFQLPITAYIMSYGGMIFDIMIGVILCVPRTVKIGTILSVFFHVTNKLVFNIGVFPAISLAITTLFWPYNWPTKYFDQLTKKSKMIEEMNHKPNLSQSEKQLLQRLTAIENKRKELLQLNYEKKKNKLYAKNLKPKQIVILVLIALFVLLQVLLPLRQHMYRGEVGWTEYGHTFSWRMKLREKTCNITIHMTFPNQTQPQPINPRLHLNRKQALKFSSRPDLIAQFAHFLSEKVESELGERGSVYVGSICSLNGRPPKYLTDPTFDVASYPIWQWPYPWVSNFSY